MSSNLQQVEEMNTSQVKSTIKFLKEEIKFGTINSSFEEKNKTSDGQYCKNMATGKLYSFLKGSSSESQLYKVMPVDGQEKIYFDSKDEYESWTKRKKFPIT